MIKFLVDSSSDYSLEEINEKHLELVPISVTLMGTAYRDVLDLDRNRFYELLQKSKEFPKTSQPSPQDFLELFQKAKENGDSLICILLSSGVSGTFQSAHLAKNMIDYEEIYLIDSLSAAHGIRILTDYGRLLAENGLSAAEIADKLEETKKRIRVVAGVDTLEYLYKGGRLNKASAAIGELANLKPVLKISEEGTVAVIGKCIGKNKAIQSIVKYIEENTIDTLFPLYSLYTCGTENCEKMEEKLAAAGYMIDARLQIGSSIGAHVGPGAFGIIYIGK